MILCVTPNPAWDVTCSVPAPDRLVPGDSHRVTDVRARAGGKGVNVASVLAGFGVATLVVGPIGGQTGAAVLADLADRLLPVVAIPSSHETRRSTTVVDEVNATVLNEVGGRQPESVWLELQQVIEDRLPDARAVVVSGSLPPDAPLGLVRDIVSAARAAGVPTVLDVRGPALSAALGAGPTLVKPNRSEAQETTGHADPVRAARALVSAGAEAALVSAGAEGAVLVTGPVALRAHGPVVPAGNPTGAGDALCAGLSRALALPHRGRSAVLPTEAIDWHAALGEALAYAVAAVHSPVAGEVDPGLAHQLRPSITVEDIS